MSCHPHGRCITCGDVGVEMLVLHVDGDTAVCADESGAPRTIEVGLVDPVAEGDVLLVHADVALVRL